MTPRTDLRLLAAAWACCAALLARPATAQSSAAAEELFAQGRAAMDSKDFETACQRFRASNQLDPAVGTVLNLAVCERTRGRLATAWELFRAVHEKLPPGDPRRDYVQTELAQIEPRLPKLTLTPESSVPPGTRVKDGEAEYTGAALGVPLPMDPGEHHFVVDAPNHEARSYDVTLAEAASETLLVAPGQEIRGEAVPAPAAGGQPSPEQPAKQGRDTRLLGFIAGGVGVVGVGVGITTGVMALGKKSTADEQCSKQLELCTREGHDAAEAGRTLAAVSTVGWVVGVLGLGAGAYFILTSTPSSQTALQTDVTTAGASLRVVRSF